MLCGAARGDFLRRTTSMPRRRETCDFSHSVGRSGPQKSNGSAPSVDRHEGGGIKKALFGKVVSAAESDPQTTLACSTGLFGFLRSSNGAQTISGEAALEWKNVRKWVVQDISEAVGPPWFGAGLTGLRVRTQDASKTGKSARYSVRYLLFPPFPCFLDASCTQHV